MGKTLNKLLSAAAFAAAGAYAYKTYTEYKKVKEENEASEGFEENTGARDVVDFFKEKKDEFMASREYVVLNEKAKSAKDILVKTVTEAAEKFAEKAEEMKDGVGVVSEDEKETAEDFEFEEFDEEATKTPEEDEVEETSEDDDDFEDNFSDEVIDEI